MSITSPLDDVVTKGKAHYHEGRGFRRWSLIMVQKYGTHVSPHLEDAWAILEADPASAHEQAPKPQKSSAAGVQGTATGLTSIREFTTMKIIGWKAFTGGLICGTALATLAFLLLVQRYRVISSSTSLPIRLDTWTGKSWIMTSDRGWYWEPLQERARSHSENEKHKTKFSVFEPYTNPP
jgi:hypothetical protein